jgi:hypothetical protein
MEIRVEGIDKVLKNLKNISDKAKEIEGERKIKFTELFTDSFMKKYTDFATIQDFADNCEKSLGIGFIDIDTDNENFKSLINERTSFDNWDEMIGKATAEWAGKKLGIK